MCRASSMREPRESVVGSKDSRESVVGVGGRVVGMEDLSFFLPHSHLPTTHPRLPRPSHGALHVTPIALMTMRFARCPSHSP